MNQKRWIGLLLAGLLCLLGCPVPAMAVSHESSVYGNKTIVQTEAENGREFCLNYQVWSDQLVDPTDPGNIVLLLDHSQSMGGLAEKPDGARYLPNTSYEGILNEKTPLYASFDSGYLPVALSGGFWKASNGEIVGKRVGKADMFSQAVFQKGEAQTKMERMQQMAEEFLRKLAETSPKSSVGLLFLGAEKDFSLVMRPAGEELEKLLGEVRTCEISGEKPLYASALQKTAEMAKRREVATSLTVISISSGERDLEDDKAIDGVEKSRRALQQIRESGGKTTCILLANPDEKKEEFWRDMCSAPLEDHFFLGMSKGGADCLEQVLQELSLAFSVELVQEVDPRFQIAAMEQARLRAAGAQVEKNQGGIWSVSWQIVLPRAAEAPWTAKLILQAQEDFPGGNDIPTDGENAGIYKSKKRIADLPATFANVPVILEMKDIESSLFLGEAIKTSIDGVNVEERLYDGRVPNWYGKGKTGVFSYLWEEESCFPAGSLEQLALLRPQENDTYYFRVTFCPDSKGLISAGKPVTKIEALGRYCVHVVPGTVKVELENDAPFMESSVLFRLEGNGMTLYREAKVEADPESEKLSLETEFTGLPYGKYTLSPQDPSLFVGETEKTCLLGVCEENDTVSIERNWQKVNFILRESKKASAVFETAAEAFQLIFFRDGEFA